MGETTALDGVLGGGWDGWAQANASAVITSLLPAKTPTTSVASTSGAVVTPAPVGGATVGGFKVTTLLMIGAAVLVAGFVFMRK